MLISIKSLNFKSVEVVIKYLKRVSKKCHFYEGGTQIEKKNFLSNSTARFSGQLVVTCCSLGANDPRHSERQKSLNM